MQSYEYINIGTRIFSYVYVLGVKKIINIRIFLLTEKDIINISFNLGTEHTFILISLLQ